MKRGADKDLNPNIKFEEECCALLSVVEFSVLMPFVVLVITIMVMSFLRNPAGGFGYIGNRVIGLYMFFGWVELNERWKNHRIIRASRKSNK